MRRDIRFSTPSFIIVLFILVAVGCDAIGIVDPLEETPSEVFIQFAQDSSSYDALNATTTNQGTFAASGAISDTGMYREVVVVSSTRLYGFRQLDGARGSLFLHLSGDVDADRKRADVRVTISKGSGLYSRLSGEHTIEVALNSGIPHMEPMNPLMAELDAQ